MTSTAQHRVGDFYLTPHQQRLLYEALNANKANGSPANNDLSSFSPLDALSSREPTGVSSLNESPLIDYDYDFSAADSSFDFSFDDAGNPKMIGDLPGVSPAVSSTAKSDSAENDGQDKRSHPHDDEEDENGAKRRESDDRVAKKPGRKPLTTEPSTKRKAQNRAAQRAFRERKERHLKDLELKVQELVKASETTNNENDQLRAKLERMTVELNEYKKRLSLVPNSRSSTQIPPNTFGRAFINNITDVNFQFEFPKFGKLPGPSDASNGVGKKTSVPEASAFKDSRREATEQVSPRESRGDNWSPGNQSNWASPPGLDGSASLNSTVSPKSGATNTSHGSFDSHFGNSATTSSSSPCSSTNSQMCGTSSSCGTSPEPLTQSPMGFKSVDTLATIGEEQQSFSASNQDFGHLSSIDVNDYQWLPQTNFQFDPQLFTGYREPQDSALQNMDFDEAFFKDAFDIDFNTPYNAPTEEAPPKKSLIAEIDAAKNADALDSNGQLLTCHSIWERLQDCPKVQAGDFDLDGLCMDLQKKAKCSGSGAVVDEKDFHRALEKYLGKTAEEVAQCAREKQQAAKE